MLASLEAWRAWMRAWFAAHWSPEDLPGLCHVVRLYDEVERGEFHRSTELRGVGFQVPPPSFVPSVRCDLDHRPSWTPCLVASR